MRRLLVILSAFFATLALTVSPAEAMSSDEASLIYLGPVPNKYINKTDCSFTNYHIDNADWFDLEYLGPDHKLYFGEGSGKWDKGKVGTCPQSDWPSGYYWLRKVHVEGTDGVSTWDRHTGNVTYSDGDVQKHGLNLTRSDFVIR